MATIRPFSGIHYASRPDLELSKLIAPPYDVLDERGKAALQAKHPNNIVTVDLPHMPPKAVGPDEVYAKANTTLQAWLERRHPRAATSGPRCTRTRRPSSTTARPSTAAGSSAWSSSTRSAQAHIVPHEKTYKGPIEDRMKLMRSTGMQLSPIFGLFSDDRSEVTQAALPKRRPTDARWHARRRAATSSGRVIDADVENDVIDMMGTKPDLHRRRTPPLHDRAAISDTKPNSEPAAPLPPSHPANYCMFVLVGMQDDGLLILPTHRLIGGLDGFDIEQFRKGADQQFRRRSKRR